MPDKQNNKLRWVAGGLALVILLGASGYWFAVRPASITKTCNHKAIKYAEKIPGKYHEAYMVGFEACKHGRGL